MNDKLHPALAEHAMEQSLRLGDELQLERERHRKTWRQLEQAIGVLGKAAELIDEQGKHIAVDMLPAGQALMMEIRAALSQQAEPSKTVYPAVVTWPDWANWCGLDPSGCWVFYEQKPETTDNGRIPAGGAWGKPRMDEPQPCWAVMLYPRKAEPAPAQDEEVYEGTYSYLCELLAPHTVEAGGQLPASVCDAFRVLLDAFLSRPAQTEQQPALWARQCDLDGQGPAIFAARKRVEESGYVVPFYAPIAQTEQPEQSVVIELPEKLTCDDGYPSDDAIMCNEHNRALDKCRRAIEEAGLTVKE